MTEQEHSEKQIEEVSAMVDKNLMDELRSRSVDESNRGILAKAFGALKYLMTIAESGASYEVKNPDGSVGGKINNDALRDWIGYKTPRGSADEMISGVEEFLQQNQDTAPER